MVCDDLTLAIIMIMMMMMMMKTMMVVIIIMMMMMVKTLHASIVCSVVLHTAHI